MVQLNKSLQFIIINAIGLCNAIEYTRPQINRQRISHSSGSIPAATSCHQIDCGPSHVCQVVRKGFCIPLLPCPSSIATCIPVANPRIGVSTPKLPVEALRFQVSTPRLPLASSRFGEQAENPDNTYKFELSKVPKPSRSTNSLRKTMKNTKRKEDTSHQNRGEYKDMVKGLSTPKLPQFPFLDNAQKTLITGFYNSFYPHSSKRSSPFKATKAPLVFITQRDIEKRLKDTRNKEENHLFSLLHGLRHVKPFFRLKGPGMGGFTKRVDKTEEFKSSDRVRSTPSPLQRLRSSPSSFTPSQPYPYQKYKYKKPVKINQKLESTKKKTDVAVDVKDSNYQTLMNVLNEKRKKNATKIVIHHNGFQPKNKAEFEFNMRTMREHLQKVKAKEVFQPVMKKMFDMDAVKPKSEKDPNQEETLNTTTSSSIPIQAVSDVVNELTTAVQDIEIETTTEGEVENIVEDNEIDLSEWLELSKITPKRRRIVSRRKEKESATEDEKTRQNIGSERKKIVSRRTGFPRENEQNKKIFENLESDGSKVKETYKMDFDRPIITKHKISLEEFNEMVSKRPIIKKHVISLDDFEYIRDSVPQ